MYSKGYEYEIYTFMRLKFFLNSKYQATFLRRWDFTLMLWTFAKVVTFLTVSYLSPIFMETYHLKANFPLVSQFFPCVALPCDRYSKWINSMFVFCLKLIQFKIFPLKHNSKDSSIWNNLLWFNSIYHYILTNFPSLSSNLAKIEECCPVSPLFFR